MYNNFDTTRHDAVWIPDEFALTEILLRAPIYDHAYIRPTSWILGTGKKYLLHFCDKEGADIFSDDWTELWSKAAEIANKAIAAGAPPKFNGRRMAALEIASSALEMYNAWSNGDVFELYIETFDKEGCPLSCEPICTFYGGYEADKFLEEELK